MLRVFITGCGWIARGVGYLNACSILNTRHIEIFFEARGAKRRKERPLHDFSRNVGSSSIIFSHLIIIYSTVGKHKEKITWWWWWPQIWCWLIAWRTGVNLVTNNGWCPSTSTIIEYVITILLLLGPYLHGMFNVARIPKTQGENLIRSDPSLSIIASMDLGRKKLNGLRL